MSPEFHLSTINIMHVITVSTITGSISAHAVLELPSKNVTVVQNCVDCQCKVSGNV